MKFTLAAVLAAAAVSATDVQTAHFTFRSPCNSPTMDLTVKADGNAVDTHETRRIGAILANDFPIQSHCDLDTDGKTELKLSRHGDDQILELHPPVAIKSITCKGHCIPNGSPAYPGGVLDPSVPCCNGLVLDTWCKAYSSVGH